MHSNIERQDNWKSNKISFSTNINCTTSQFSFLCLCNKHISCATKVSGSRKELPMLWLWSHERKRKLFPILPSTPERLYRLWKIINQNNHRKHSFLPEFSLFIIDASQVNDVVCCGGQYWTTAGLWTHWAQIFQSHPPGHHHHHHHHLYLYHHYHLCYHHHLFIIMSMTIIVIIKIWYYII